MKLRLPAVGALGLVVACLWSVPTVGAQTQEIEMLSKADAIHIFGMSRQEWDRNISALVASGAATRTFPSASGLVGLAMPMPEGVVITRLDYSTGDAKPSFAQMAFTLPESWLPLFTDTVAKDTIENIKKQLAPEFEVEGRMDRLRAGPAFFFIIKERAGAQRASTPRPSGATAQP